MKTDLFLNNTIHLFDTSLSISNENTEMATEFPVSLTEYKKAPYGIIFKGGSSNHAC